MAIMVVSLQKQRRFLTKNMTLRLKLTIAIIGIALAIAIVLAILLKRNQAGRNNQAADSNPAAPSAEQIQLRAERGELQKKLEAVSAQDQDLDGISDSEEKKIGTNPTAADTDGDGLLDGDEIKIYKTSPLKADTDGNGLSDRADLLRQPVKQNSSK